MSLDYVDRRHTQTEDRYAADDLETMQGAKRYAAHLFELFRPYVGRRVLEVGCGIGTMSERLAGVADRVLGIEPNPSCAVQVREHMRAEPKFSLRECLLEDCDPVELASHRFDTVFCVNVLEHIEDDVGRAGHVHARRAAWRPRAGLGAGGAGRLRPARRRAGASPPLHQARPCRRRSRARELEIVSLRYTNPIGLIGWMYNAHVGKSTTHSPMQIKLFETLVAPWALPLDRLIPPPVGLSLVAVGRRAR